MNALTAGDQKELPADRAPTADQRAALEAHVAHVDGLLAPAAMDQVAAQFTGLLVSFPAQAISDTAAKAKAQAYFIALEGLPAWAVQEACRRWLRGEPGPNKDANFAFAPSAPQLRILADSLTADLRMHRLKMRRILDAKVRVELPEADRARMVQRLRDVIAPHTNEGSA